MAGGNLSGFFLLRSPLRYHPTYLCSTINGQLNQSDIASKAESDLRKTLFLYNAASVEPIPCHQPLALHRRDERCIPPGRR